MSEFHGKYLSVTSFKSDGTGVATPVWFVAENGHLLIETDAGSGKAKRIRRNASVSVALCTSTGKLKGDPVPAHAEFVPEDERAHVEQLMAHKYRVDRILVLPVYRVLQRLFGKQTLTRDHPVVLSITLD